ncbi:asparagine synthase C-terminal domain-containing protein [Povalibacter sp.]|uniref:asparagine synthase C-terminal domain-containing protein n=1 Tax=Povalibacter sp. TaxID=1962978 RepID=UPI002F3FA632
MLQTRERLQQLSSQWHCVFDIAGCCVFCADSQPRSLRSHVLPDNAGVILGSLFERATDLGDDTACRRASLDSTTTQATVQSRGQHLIEHYWGNYVALLCDRGRVTALVSPMSSLACLASTVGGATWLYACLADALQVGLPPPTPTHTYVRRAVLGQLPEANDSLHGMIRLNRGEALDLHPGAQPPGLHRRCAWDPHRFTETSALIDSPVVAAHAIRNVVRSCTQTLARDYDHIQLRLSGGLDSSIIAGCLRDAPARVACHTYLHIGTSADPRSWAHLAADHAGYPLSEHLVNTTSLSLPSLDRLRRSADIVSRTNYLFLPQLERTLCNTQGPSAVFTGDGGDAGFCSDCVALALVQRLHHRGLTLRAWRLSRHVALATHRSQWHVLTQAIKAWRGRVPWTDPTAWNSQDMELIALDLAHAARSSLKHPWLPDNDDEAPLTFFRLGALVLPIEERDLSVRTDDFGPEIVQPLCSQPVVELMLRIPVYLHFEDGRDRGLARRAFAQDASRPNLERVWKDRAPGFFSELILRHVEWLREVLLDGVLVGAHYLDRRKLEAALAATPSHTSVNPGELLRYLDIELWARQWKRA